jgi:endoglucanase
MQGFGVGGARAASDPFDSIKWYADPDSPVQQQATAWRSARPGDAALLDVVARQQSVDWVVSAHTSFLEQYINQRLDLYARVGGTPILAIYNVPRLNCGDGNGAANGDAYRAWIDRIASSIGQRKVILMVEPDGLTVTECLSGGSLAERYALINYAVGVFKRNPNAGVYIDAGEGNRNTVEEIVPILQQGNIAQADGFFLNSTVYQYTSTEVAYGLKVSQALGGKHFVVDTSRNGLGPGTDGYCNARGRALGVAPTIQTGESVVDAFIWLKRVWESDDTCNRGDPAGGQFFFDYTLDLVRRSLQPFSDLPADIAQANNPAQPLPSIIEQIRQLTLRGYIRGNGNGTFGPDSTTLRAQMAALITRPVGWELDRFDSSFTDHGTVDAALWRNVSALEAYKVAKGFGDGTFQPTGPVLYEQVLLFISRAMQQKGYWVQQPDNAAYSPNLPNSSAREQEDRRDIMTYVYYMQALGGVPDFPATGNFTTWDQPAPRAWFAQALYRALRSQGLI